MKSTSGQVFAISLLSLLAALSFWLERTISAGVPEPDGKSRHDPDAIAENFSALQMDENGRVKYRLVAPYLEHFPDDLSSELKNPTLVSYRPDAPPMTLTSKNARVANNGETIYLWDDVTAVREASSERPAMVARMPDLTLQPDTGVAHTDSPVEITEAASWMKGVGLHLDNDTSTLVLQSQVTGLIYPRRAPK
jgi:lipopolysaccharide export system protein LptC